MERHATRATNPGSLRPKILEARKKPAMVIPKNELSEEKLSLFEEWECWHNERAAIMEFDAGLSREDAEKMAKDFLRKAVGEI